MSKVSKDILSNFIIFFMGSIGTKLITFLLVPYYTNLLSTAEYGAIDIINTDVQILILIVAIGFPDAIFRFALSKDCDNEEVLKIGLTFTAVTFFFVGLILTIVNIFISWAYMKYLLLMVILSVYYSIITNYIKARWYTGYYVCISIVQTLFLVLFNILFLSVFKWGVDGYFRSVILSYLFPLIFVIFEKRIYRVFRAKFNKQLLVRMLRYGFPLIFSTISWWIISSCDRYMLLYFYGEDSVGIYSVAARMPVIMQTLIAILDTVWQISVTDVYETNKKELSMMFKSYMSYFRTIGFVGCSALLILTKPIMMFIARNDFFEGWRYAPILILSMIFPFSCGMTSSLYKAYESNKGLMKSVVIGCLLNISLNVVLIKPFGIMGAAVSTMISRAFISLYQVKDTERFLEFDRGYRHIVINIMVLIGQAVLLICIPKYIYILQLFVFAIVCIINRKVILAILEQFKIMAEKFMGNINEKGIILMPYNLLSKMVLAWRELIYRFAPKIKIASTEETLKEIRENKKCACRFGDGELSFALNLGKIGYQKENLDLKNRLLEIFEKGSNDNCLVCIPLALYSFKDFNRRSSIFWFKYGALYRRKFQTVLNPNHKYYDSQISRVYINRKKQTSKYFDMWKEIWKDKNVLIVEGEKTRFGSDNDLFLRTGKLSRILCPPESAYDYYDEILAEVKNKCGEYDLVLIALGITATVLAWDLSNLGVWAIDIGNMDNEYEWFKLGVKKPVPLKSRYVFEAKDGKNVDEMNDPKYLSQIIARVGV